MNAVPFTRLFIDVVRRYVTCYKDCAFKFYFDQRDAFTIGDSEKVVEVRIKNAEKVFKRIFTEGSLGLGESYCEGTINIDDEEYKYFLFIFVRTFYNKYLFSKLSPIAILQIVRSMLFHSSFSRGSLALDVNCHYSLMDWFDHEYDSNSFYLYWLASPYIQYSCGLWDDNTATVEEAQINKFEFYAQRLGISKKSKGQTLLDLGCGWGGFILYMAEKYRLMCTGVTLSKAQAQYVQDQSARRQLHNNVHVEVNNINNTTGTYDYIVSFGVLEHIINYNDFYKTIAKCLNYNGSALVHSMFHRTRFYKGDPFLLKYIFHRSRTPHTNNHLRICSKYFQYVDRNDFPDGSYPKTLQCWYDTFCANDKKIRELLTEKSKSTNIEFSIRTFKHYLMLAYCGLSERGLVSNILLRNPL
jgi:cyclopropane-fatty-acyl-phospholipid synthase